MKDREEIMVQPEDVSRHEENRAERRRRNYVKGDFLTQAKLISF